MATKVTLARFNTLSLTASTAYQLVSQDGSHKNLSIINLGPGNLFIRADADPTATDPASMQVPANVTVPPTLTVNNGLLGLRVLADATGKISVQMTSR